MKIKAILHVNFLNKRKYLYIVFFFFLTLVQKSYCTQTDYFGIFDVEYAKRNSENTTVILSNFNDIGDCVCDITQDTCDYLCCCDKDCPNSIIGKWLNDTNNICLDKQNSRNDLFTYCFADNILYKFNRKRGMQEFRDPLSNLFCVTFDNSSVKDRFYSSIQSLNETLTRAIFQYFIDPQLKGNYFNSITNQTYIQGKDIYEVNDILRMKYYNNNTLFFQDKFYLFTSGAFGECIRTEPLRFMKNIPKTKCGYRLKKFSDCEKHQWNAILNNNLTFFIHPLKTNGTIKPKINRVFFRDYESQNLSEYTESGKTDLKTLLNYTDSYLSQKNCLCNNLLEEMSLSFIIDLNLWELKELQVDVILATNVKSKCENKFYITQSYSASFLEKLTTIERSGNPGYTQSSNLLIMKNSTITSKEFQAYKEGYIIYGRNDNGTCINKTSSGSKPIINSNFDHPLKFKQDSLYACYKNFTFNEFYNFCINKKWKDLVILNVENDLKYIGKYGSSEVYYQNDWVEVMKQIDFNTTYWSPDNRTCSIPNSLNLDILYNKAGYLYNKQYSVITGKLYSSYENITFTGNPEMDTIIVNFKFGTNYLNLKKNVLTETRENPSILPLLPSDIVAPFTNQLD